MGVLVQVLPPGLGSVRSTFTDEHGRYTISNLAPGRYQLRATASLLAPLTRTVLDFGTNSRVVLNLTMSSLFDTASWLPAERRRTDEPEDEWKWTIRSSANRPILRLAGDPEGADVGPILRAEQSAHRPVQGRIAVETGTGTLEQQGMQESVLLQTRTRRDETVAMEVVQSERSGSASQLSASLERKGAFGAGTRTVARYTSASGLRFGGADTSLETFRLLSAEQTQLGAWLEMQAGGELQAVRVGEATSWESRPFLQLTATPGSTWNVRYRISTGNALQEYDDAAVRTDRTAHAAGQEETVALDGRGAPTLQKGIHQEAALSHSFGPGTLEVAVFRENLSRVALSGIGVQAGQSVEGLETAAQSDRFAVLGPGYRGDGAHVSYTATLRNGLLILAEYVRGDALRSPDKPTATVAEALAGTKSNTSQAAAVAVRGRLHSSGTQFRASYRWQPQNDVSAVDPYSTFQSGGYLGLFVRQQIRPGSWMPTGLEATIDVSNLLAQGYRPFLSVDGRTLYLAQTPRAVQVGFAFNF